MLVGFSLVIYPTVSTWWSTKKQQNTVDNYDIVIGETDKALCEQMLKSAHEYNLKLSKIPSPFENYDKIDGYDSVLNIFSGIMGYITIPKINVELPIYHGTESETLEIGAGHMEGFSLPVGGKNTHAVICRTAICRLRKCLQTLTN